MDKSEETRIKSAQYWKEFRKKIKSDPDRYQKHRKDETERIREYRKKRQNEKSKQRNRELQRERQKGYRERMKAEGKCLKSSKPKTCENREELRRKWREQKRCQRNKKRNAYEMKQISALSQPSNQDFKAKNENKIGTKRPDNSIIAEKQLSTNMNNNEINVPNKKAKTADIAHISPPGPPCDTHDFNSFDPEISYSTQIETTVNVCQLQPFDKCYKRNNVKSNDNKSSSVDANKTNKNIGKRQNTKCSDLLSFTSERCSITSAIIVPPKADAYHLEQKQQKMAYKYDKLKQTFNPILEKLCRQDSKSILTNQPIHHECRKVSKSVQISGAVVLDQLRTTTTKKPMDLIIIKEKLDNCRYTEPWQLCDDVWMMFDNALSLYNTDPQAYQYCLRLAETFGVEIDGVMQSIGYCCGHKYTFTPQVLCCAEKQFCTIPRDAYYYRYEESQRQNNLYSHRKNYWKCFQYCEKCFHEIKGDEVELTDDPTQPVRRISKDKFTRLKNNHLCPELFVECNECRQKVHQICALHFEEIWPERFICDNCYKTKGTKRKENTYTAKSIPKTKLDTYLEKKVNDFLERDASDKGNVTIRVLSSRDKEVEVKPSMKARFCDNKQMADTFKYRAKAIFAFQEIDGTDVCFFGMHVHEYGSDCPEPNSRRVYISYLDSVNFFQPRQLRTAVYHEILIGYLEYVKKQGYLWAHIWACPPSEGDDYIFFCHPTDQKIPKPNRLQEWYTKMLDKAIATICDIHYQDILQYAQERKLTSATQIPYFDGDFWSSVLEDIIDELKQEESAKKVRKRKRKGRKSGRKKKNPDEVKVPCDDNELTKRIIATMKEHKEAFFVIRLYSEAAATQSLFPITDPDPLTTYDLMDGRDAFLAMATEKHYEFSSLRRAKYSTLAMLYEIHNQGRHNVVFTCNNCKAHVGTWWQCTNCENFNLCITCYQREVHAHRMDKHGLDLDGGTSRTDKEKDTGKSPRKLIETLKQSLEHACQCRDANCRLPRCQHMKHVVSHAKSCEKKTVCSKCKQLIALCLYHANHCTDNRCKVLLCEEYKQKLKEHNRRQQAQMLQRRKAVMQQMNILK